MEDDAVIKALRRERLDLLDMLGGQVGAKGDGDLAAFQLHHQRVFRVWRGGGGGACHEGGTNHGRAKGAAGEF